MKGLLILALLAALGACGGDADRLSDIIERGELRFVTRNGPTTFFTDRGEPRGIEYELAALLAADLQVSLRVDTVFSQEELFRRLKLGEADIAGAQLALIPDWSDRYPHSGSYGSQRAIAVYKTGFRKPRGPEELAGLRIVTLRHSSHSRLLERLTAQRGLALDWRELESTDSLRLLREVLNGLADVAIVNEREFRVQRNLVPRLDVAFRFEGELPTVWYLSPDGSQTALQRYLSNFLARLDADGTLKRLRERDLGYTREVSRVGSQTFVNAVEERLPRYRHLIQLVAAQYALDWQLLAAVAYQESHWNPEATSPTGVRGMMMLTGRTARQLGVENRLNALESLRGGARYLKDLRRRLPSDIAEPDRTWLALAAYNIGMGHLEDARVLTERHGGNPHLWRDVMEHLPKLEQREYYTTVRHGYARGLEAVTYVQKIRHYRSILRWQRVNEALPREPWRVGSDNLPSLPRTLFRVL